MRRGATLLSAVLAPLLAGWLGLLAPLSQASSGSISSQVRLVYEQAGTIPPCRFTSPQLTAAQNAVDAYDLEYFADYIAAIQTALTLRAAGACSKSAAAVSHAPAGRIPPAAPLPATLTSPTRSGIPLPMLLMAIFTVLLAGAAALLTLGQRSAAVAAWADRWRHGSAETRYRAADALDRLRR